MPYTDISLMMRRYYSKLQQFCFNALPQKASMDGGSIDVLYRACTLLHSVCGFSQLMYVRINVGELCKAVFLGYLGISECSIWQIHSNLIKSAL